MSKLIDERLVSMEFDNRKFESNVKKSIDTIDNLKKSLDFSNTTGSINNSLGRINSSALVSALENASGKFSALEVAAITAISNITNRVVDLGINTVKSLSIDNVIDGWNKYADKTTSVATLISQGFSMDEVNSQLEKLNWFTDETSYKFTDMVSNIGKFTAAGQNLEDSVEAMMGIANWAALSGQNATKASSAMYQLSQAMGSGVVRKDDWRSIQTLNMDTTEFREKALEAAVAAGTLQKSITGMYITNKGNTFDTKNFEAYLTTDAWFTSDILMDTLSKYSKAVDQIYDKYIELGETVTTSDIIEEFGDEFDEFGRKAFRAGQEAKTFEDAIGSVKEAVASKWLITFESFFGGYDEAKVLWTDLANELYDVFAEGGNFRNAILKTWKQLGGRDDIFANTEENTGAFWNLYYAIIAIKDAISDAWDQIFPIGTAKEAGEKLKDFTARVKELSERLTPSEAVLSRITSIFKGLFSVLKAGIKIIQGIWNGLKPLFKVLKQLVGVILEAFARIGEEFAKWVNETEKLGFFGAMVEKVSQKIAYFTRKLQVFIRSEGFQEWLTSVRSKLSSVLAFVKTIPGIIKNTIGNFKTSIIGKYLTNVWETIKTAFEKIRATFSGFKNVDTSGVDELSDKTVDKFGPIKKFFEGVGAIFAGLLSVVQALLPVLSQLFSFLGTGLKKIGEKIASVFTGEEGLFSITDLFSTAFWSSLIAYFSGMFASLTVTLKDVLQGFADLFDSTATLGYAKAMKTFAEAILMIVAALVVLAMIDKDKITGALVVLATVVGGMLLVMQAMKTMFTGFSKSASNLLSTLKSLAALSIIGNVVKQFAIGVAILVASVLVLSFIKPEKIMDALMAVLVLLASLTAAMIIISKTVKKAPLAGSAMIAMSLALLLIVAAVKSLSKIEGTKLVTSVLSMVVLMTALVAAMALLSKYAKAAALGAIGAAIFAVALIPMVVALKLLGNMTAGQLAKGIIAIAGMTLIISILSRVMGLMSGLKLVMFAAGLAALGVAFTIMAGTIKIIGSIEESAIKLAKKTIKSFMTMLIFTLVLATKNMTKKLIMFSAGMAALGAAFIIIGFAMKQIASIQGLGKAVATIISLSVIIAVLGKVMGVLGAASVAIFAASMIIFSVSLTTLAGALAVLGALSWGTIGKGLVVIVASLALLAGAALLLTPLVPAILGIVVAFGAFAIVCLALAAALSLTATALTTIATVGAAAMMALTNVILGMIALVPQISTAIAEGVLKFFETIFEHGPILVELIVTLFNTVLSAIDSTLPTILATVGNIINGVLGVLDEYIPKIVENLNKILPVVIQFITDNMPVLIEMVINAMLALLDALNSRIGEYAEKLIDIIINIVEAITKKVPELFASLRKLVWTLIDSLLTFISDFIPQINARVAQFFIDIFNGLADTIDEKTPALVESIHRLGQSILNAIKAFFGIHSPSTKMEEIGVYLMEGLKNGIGKKAAEVWEKVTGIFSQLGSKVSTAVSGFVSKGAALITNIRNGITSKASELKTKFSDILGDMKESFEKKKEDFKSVASNLMTGLKNGLQDGWSKVGSAVSGVWDNIVKGAKDAFGVHSPSRVFAEIGYFNDLGLAQGIEKGLPKVLESTEEMSETAIDGAKRGIAGAIEQVGKILENGFDDDITIRPVMDLSAIQNGANQINGMMHNLDGYSITTGSELANANARSFASRRNPYESNAEDIRGLTTAVRNIGEGQNVTNNTFNITGDSPKDIAEEISKILQRQAERRHAVWAR